MTKLSARKWVEKTRTDIAHVLDGSDPHKVPTKKSKNNVCLAFLSVHSKIRAVYFGKIGAKWVAIAQIGLRLGGNEATRFKIMFKPDFYMRKCLVGVTLGQFKLFLAVRTMPCCATMVTGESLQPILHLRIASYPQSESLRNDLTNVLKAVKAR